MEDGFGSDWDVVLQIRPIALTCEDLEHPSRKCEPILRTCPIGAIRDQPLQDLEDMQSDSICGFCRSEVLPNHHGLILLKPKRGVERPGDQLFEEPSLEAWHPLSMPGLGSNRLHPQVGRAGEI